MSKSPPIPPEQRSGRAAGAPAKDDAGAAQHGNAGVNLKLQGRYGNTHQNLTHQGRQQDR
jgi:hypothetical protein